MSSMDSRNRKIIDAVIRKEQAVCSGAIALIGIYGSFMTGDVHPLSDLDLLILINDDRGWKLGKAFIQEDLGVGHDIYCTGWESLRQDAEYAHPHISRLMDSQIVYCADDKARDSTGLSVSRRRTGLWLMSERSEKGMIELKDGQFRNAGATRYG